MYNYDMDKFAKQRVLWRLDFAATPHRGFRRSVAVNEVQLDCVHRRGNLDVVARRSAGIRSRESVILTVPHVVL